MRLRSPFVLFLLAAADTFASGGAHHAASPADWSFIFSVINFVILVLLAYFFVKKPAREFFRKRATTTRLEMEKAKKFYDEASGKYREVEARLKQADTEGKKLLLSLKEEGEQEKQQILKQARELAESIRLDAERIIAQETKKASEALKTETVSLAAELAAKQLKTGLSVQDQENLGAEFIAELKNLKGAN